MTDRGSLSRRVRRGAWVTGTISAIVLIVVGAFGYYERDPIHLYPAKGTSAPVAVVNFSGDMGLRFLLGASTPRGLTEHGINVIGYSTPAMFRRHRTRAAVTAIVAEGIRATLARTGVDRVVVIGQSYGADIVQTGLADLPIDLRAHVAAIILIIPGNTVYFRADPSGILYHTAPDSIATTTANTLTWAPLTCIQGVEESDSLCPELRVPGAQIVAMPGGHDLDHDAEGVLDHVLAAIDQAVPDVRLTLPHTARTR